MWKPWENQTGFAKALALFATILTISFGLCGINAIVMGPLSTASNGLGNILIGTAYIELLGIIIGLIGVIGTLVVWGAAKFINIFRKETDHD